MGSDKLFWFIPFINDSGYPKGDGLTWPVNELGDEFNDNFNKKDLEKNKSDSSFNTNNKIKAGVYGSSSTAYESNSNVIRKNLGNNVINDTGTKIIEMAEKNQSK